MRFWQISASSVNASTMPFMPLTWPTTPKPPCEALHLMFYSVRHITHFAYSNPVRESVMEVRMQPRSELAQAVRNFQIATVPRANLFAYTDHFGNAVYNFN